MTVIFGVMMQKSLNQKGSLEEWQRLQKAKFHLDGVLEHALAKTLPYWKPK